MEAILVPNRRPLVVRGRRRPCDCDGNGVLAYLSCPGCRHVLLVCDEIGNVFDNLDDPLASAPLVIWRSAGQMCPECKKVLLADFQWATENDLSARGIGSDAFEVGGPDVDRSIGHAASS